MTDATNYTTLALQAVIDEAVQPYKSRIAELEAELAALKATVSCGRSIAHPPHKHMTGRKVYQCAGVTSEEG